MGRIEDAFAKRAAEGRKALVTYQRAEGELWEMRCAENFFEYYSNAYAPIPRADKPDF